MLRMIAENVTLDAASGDEPSRTISGIAVPYGVEATVLGGQRVRIEQGALPVDGPAPRLLEDHDTGKVVGKVTDREDTPDGMLFSAKIAATRAGDDLLELLKMGALDSVSIGIEALDYEMQGKTMVVKAADWQELSVVYQPAFSGARIEKIAAAQADATPDTIEPQPETENDNMSEDITPEVVEAAKPEATLPVYATAKREFAMPSAQEWIAAALEGGSQFAELTAKIKAAAPDVTTTDNDGVLPQPIVGPVYDNFVGTRPVVDAIGVKALPQGGKVFERPYVSTHTSIAVQSAELATLQAGEYKISSHSVTKGTYGGYVSLSEQIIDWSDPAIITLLLEDLGKIYRNTTDNVAADALYAGISQTASLTDPTSPAEWVSDIYDAMQTIVSNSNGNLPSHLFLAPNMFAALGKLVDGSNRPLFPTVAPSNAYGSASPGSVDMQAFGLTVVVDRNFAADTVIVGDPSGFEIFEQQKGAISVDSPSNLSRTIGWRGYFATLMIDATKFVALT